MKVQSHPTNTDLKQVEAILRGNLILKQHDYWYAIQTVHGPGYITETTELHDFALVHQILLAFGNTLPKGVYYTNKFGLIDRGAAYGLALRDDGVMFTTQNYKQQPGYWFTIKQYKYGD